MNARLELKNAAEPLLHYELPIAKWNSYHSTPALALAPVAPASHHVQLLSLLALPCPC
jgi:hypothetical protein